ncbi:MAG: alkaline phosphatase family protein [Eubacteriaceae bacterium]|nr:alkaline phosphatase family protein [Eubacteriaceae bacterium]
MENKVILISIDGMRPDGLLSCANPFAEKLMEISSYTLTARTVFPSVTLPCHMSLFLSVPPQRHGITTNIYTPPVRPIDGIFEQVKKYGGSCAMYYGWEPLRDISRPGSLDHSVYINLSDSDGTDALLTDEAIRRIEKSRPDLVFLYMGQTDEKGHDSGWMSSEYLTCLSRATDNVKKVYDLFKDEYTIIITSDHGGHDRTHGSTDDTDMLIPIFFIGKNFTPGKNLGEISIMDVAPTIADIMQIPCADGWEGGKVV